MSFQIGDPLFNALGQPGVVVKPDENKEQRGPSLKVDQDFAAVQTHFRHGYIKGLGEGPRQELYSIMDEVAALSDPAEKIATLQTKIAEYEAEISPHSRHMLGYLKSELTHLMNSYNYTPRFYEIPPSRTP